MKFLKQILLTLVLLPSFVLPILAQKPVYLWNNGVKVKPGKAIVKKDLAVEPAEGKFFTQAWTFVYYTDDGGGGYIQFSHARLGYALRQVLVHHVFYTPEGKMVYRKEILSLKDMSWDDKDNKLVMGKSSWSGFYPEFRVKVPLEGLETDMTFTCLTPPWRPGDGPVRYGAPDGEWYDVVVYIPLARVSGTIKVEGKEKKVTGFGYADHNTQTIWFMTQCEEIYALRSFSDNWSVHFLDYRSPAEFGGKRVTWLLVMKDGKIVCATDKYEIKPSDWTKEPRRGRKYPQRAKIIVNDPEFKLEGEIRGLRLLDVLDVRDQIPGWLEPTASKLIRQPAFIRQKAEVTWRIKTQGKEESFIAKGIFEYTIVEKD
jgi:hypothetical protein